MLLLLPAGCTQYQGTVDVSMSLGSVLLQWSRHNHSVALNKVESVRQAGACQGRLCAVCSEPCPVGGGLLQQMLAGLGVAATRMTLLDPASIHGCLEDHVEEDHVEEDHVVEWH